MDAALAKTLIDGGIGVISIIAIVYIVIKQMEVMKKQTESLLTINVTLGTMQETMRENTIATRNCTETTKNQIESQTILVKLLEAKL